MKIEINKETLLVQVNDFLLFIKKKMEEKSIDQKDVATAMGYSSVSTVSKILNGKATLSYEAALGLTQCVGMTKIPVLSHYVLRTKDRVVANVSDYSPRDAFMKHYKSLDEQEQRKFMFNDYAYQYDGLALEIVELANVGEQR